MEDANLSPAKKAEVQYWKDLYNQANDNNNCLCEELEKMEKALEEKTEELEKKTNELLELQDSYNALNRFFDKLEGRYEAYKYCIELLIGKEVKEALENAKLKGGLNNGL